MEDVELQQLPEAVNREIRKNSQEIVYAEEEEQGALERKPGRLIEQNRGVLRNACQLYERKHLPFPLIKIQENHKDVEHQIRHIARDSRKECKMKNDECTRRNYEICLEKRLRLRDKKCQLIAQKQRFVQGNIFVNRKQKLCTECNSSEKQYRLKAFNRSLSVSDPFVTDNRRSFRESRENAINNMKNVKITDIDQKSLEKNPCFLLPLDRSNDNSMFRQRLNYDFSERENGVDRIKMTPEQYDKMKFENEKITRKTPSNRLAKIMLDKDRFYPNEIRLPLSPESGFCERSPDINLGRPHLYSDVLRNDKILDKENNSSSESNLSQKSVMGDFNSVIPDRYVKSHIIETPISISNNIRDIDKNKSSPDSELPHEHPVNNDNNLMKCSKSQVVEESCSSNKIEPDIRTIDGNEILSHNNNKETLEIDGLTIHLDNNLSCEN